MNPVYTMVANQKKQSEIFPHISSTSRILSSSMGRTSSIFDTTHKENPTGFYPFGYGSKIRGAQGNPKKCSYLDIATPLKTNGWRAPKWWLGKGNGTL